MATITPLARVKEEFGGKDKLVDKIVGLLARATSPKDTCAGVCWGLPTASLIRLHGVATQVKSAGGKDPAGRCGRSGKWARGTGQGLRCQAGHSSRPGRLTDILQSAKTSQRTGGGQGQQGDQQGDDQEGQRGSSKATAKGEKSAAKKPAAKEACREVVSESGARRPRVQSSATVPILVRRGRARRIRTALSTWARRGTRVCVRLPAVAAPHDSPLVSVRRGPPRSVRRLRSFGLGRALSLRRQSLGGRHWSGRCRRLRCPRPRRKIVRRR
jgi:hypothetical protein